MRDMSDLIMSDPTLRQMWRDIERHNSERAAAAAKADPEKHKLSSYLAEGVRSGDYTYYSVGRDGHKAVVRWCFMRGPNVAGYYLVWRERETGRTVKRTHRSAWKTAGRAETEAMRRWKTERARWAKRA